MLGKLFIFAFGLVSGVALTFVLNDRAIDLDSVRKQTGESIDAAGRYAGDLKVAASVKAALALQKDFALFGGINVDAENGVVTLAGKVATTEQRQLAELIARGVDGVERVQNDLQIHVSDESVSDASSAASNRRALAYPLSA